MGGVAAALQATAEVLLTGQLRLGDVRAAGHAARNGEGAGGAGDQLFPVETSAGMVFYEWLVLFYEEQALRPEVPPSLSDMRQFIKTFVLQRNPRKQKVWFQRRNLMIGTS